MTTRQIIPINRVSARPPYEGLDAIFQAGWLEGKRSHLQSMVKQTLNSVKGSPYEFRVLTEYVLYTALHTAKVRSLHPIDRMWGYVPEIDITFWVLTWGGIPGQADTYALRWMPTFMFVDDMSAVVTGREVFGFPKAMATFTRTSEAPEDFGLTCRAKAIEKKGPEEGCEEREIFRVECNGDGASATLEDLEMAWRVIGDTTMMGAPHIARAAFEQIRLASGDVPFPIVLLKQIPDVTRTNSVSYQRIIDAQMTSTQVYEAGKAPADIKIHFKEPFSARIAEVHGFEPVAPLLGTLWVRQDYETGFGTELTS